MAIGIDTSKWKPRKLRGTPAAKARDICAIVVIGLGFILGASYQYFGVSSKFKKSLDNLYEDPVEEVERRQMIAGGLPNRTSEGLRKLVEKSNRIDLPDK